MDTNSRIREALEIADKFCNQHTADECPDTVAIPIKEALSLLTAEPEPCEEAIEYARKVIKAEKDDQGFTVNGIASLFDSYASRREKDAREDERRRDIAGEVWDMLVDHLPVSGRTAIYDEMRELFPIPAILQGTDPAKKRVSGVFNSEPATVKLPKCDHCGAVACGTDCDGSSHYTPDGKE